MNIKDRIIYRNCLRFNKDCICGKVEADIGTKFVEKCYIFKDGTSGAVLVPDGKEYEKVDKNGNPIYVICLLDSETFFQYFIPCFESDDRLNPLGQSMYLAKWDIIHEILNKTTWAVSKVYVQYPPSTENIAKAEEEKKLKKQVLSKLDEMADTDPLINKIIRRVYFEDGSYDYMIDRHNLYFLDVYEGAMSYTHILTTLNTIIKEVKNCDDRRSR